MKFRHTGTTLEPANQATEMWLHKKRSGEVITLEEVKPATIRSRAQNRLIWKWNVEISDFVGYSLQEAHNHNKLHIGVPILQAGNEAFRNAWNELLEYLPYEAQLEAMQFTDVTRLMTVAQCKEYLDGVWQYWAEKGLELTSVEEYLCP